MSAPEDVCRYCGAPIIWGATEKRRRVALEPHEDGLLILLEPRRDEGMVEPLISEVGSPGPEAVERRYRRHAPTCPAHPRNL